MCSCSGDEGQKEDGKNEGKDTQKSDEDENQLSLTKDKAKQVAVQAKTSFDEIINSTEGNSSKMKGYGTKEDVVNELKDVMSQSLAQGLTDAYFAERDGALYLQPQGGPLWFNQDGSFKLKHPSEKEYVIVQEQSSELSGNVTMHYIIKYDGENWVLDQMKSQQKQQNSQSKVTQEQAVELVREHIGTQGENVKVEFDHMDGERYVVHVYFPHLRKISQHRIAKLFVFPLSYCASVQHIRCYPGACAFVLKEK